MGWIVVWIVELVWVFSAAILNGILDLLGYSPDWEPTRPSTRRRWYVFSAFLCFAVSTLFGGGLIFLSWWLTSR